MAGVEGRNPESPDETRSGPTSRSSGQQLARLFTPRTHIRPGRSCVPLPLRREDPTTGLPGER
jgi:hypothetical protein